MIKHTKEQLNFINNVIIPAHSGSIKKNLYSVIYDLNGKIILATDLFAKLVNYDNAGTLKNKILKEINTYQVNHLYKKLDLIRNRVIKHEKLIYYISFANYAYGFDVHANYQFPIFMPDGSVIATRTVIKKFTLFSPLTLFSQLLNNKVDSSNTEYKIDFTTQEYNIIFLLGLGLTQEEAALYIKISRGHLAKTLTKKIYAKLNVTNYPEFLVQIKKDKLINNIPPELLEPKIIILKNVGNNILQTR